jgi:adenine deaminase
MQDHFEPELNGTNKMTQFDILIRGGTIIDGLRSGRYLADIGIRYGKIVRRAEAWTVLPTVFSMRAG